MLYLKGLLKILLFLMCIGWFLQTSAQPGIDLQGGIGGYPGVRANPYLGYGFLSIPHNYQLSFSYSFNNLLTPGVFYRKNVTDKGSSLLEPFSGYSTIHYLGLSFQIAKVKENGWTFGVMPSLSYGNESVEWKEIESYWFSNRNSNTIKGIDEYELLQLGISPVIIYRENLFKLSISFSMNYDFPISAQRTIIENTFTKPFLNGKYDQFQYEGNFSRSLSISLGIYFRSKSE